MKVFTLIFTAFFLLILSACLQEVDDSSSKVQYTIVVEDDSTLLALNDVAITIKTTKRRTMKMSTDEVGRAQTPEFESADFQLTLSKNNYASLDTIIVAPTDSLSEGEIKLEVLKLQLKAIPQ